MGYGHENLSQIAFERHRDNAFYLFSNIDKLRRRGQDNEASRQVKVHTGQRPFDHFKLPKKSVKYLFIPKEFYTYYSYTVKLNLLSFTPP